MHSVPPGLFFGVAKRLTGVGVGWVLLCKMARLRTSPPWSGPVQRDDLSPGEAKDPAKHLERICLESPDTLLDSFQIPVDICLNSVSF